MAALIGLRVEEQWISCSSDFCLYSLHGYIAFASVNQ